MTAALSGCLVKDDGDPAAVGAGTTSDSMSDANETRGPTAVLVISANGTELYSSANATEDDAADNGTASGNTTASGNSTAAGNTTTANSTVEPANATAAGENSTSNETGGLVVEPGVNITFDASGSEGTNLTFSWEIGNVTSENATFDHVFTEPGNYTITLTVTDADNATDEETVDIVVGSSGAAPGTHIRDETQTFNVSTVVGGSPDCSVLMPNNVNQKTFDMPIVDVEEDGTPSKVTHIVITANRGTASAGHRLILTDPAGTEIGRGTTIDITGDYGPGTYVLEWRLCGGASNTTGATAILTYVTR